MHTEFSTTGKLNRVQHPENATRETPAHLSPKAPWTPLWGWVSVSGREPRPAHQGRDGLHRGAKGFEGPGDPLFSGCVCHPLLFVYLELLRV